MKSWSESIFVRCFEYTTSANRFEGELLRTCSNNAAWKSDGSAGSNLVMLLSSLQHYCHDRIDHESVISRSVMRQSVISESVISQSVFSPSSLSHLPVVPQQSSILSAFSSARLPIPQYESIMSPSPATQSSGSQSSDSQSSVKHESSGHQTSVQLLCNWPYGLMGKALVFGAKDCRFESCEDLSSFNIVASKTTYFEHVRQKYYWFLKKNNDSR